MTLEKYPNEYPLKAYFLFGCGSKLLILDLYVETLIFSLAHKLQLEEDSNQILQTYAKVMEKVNIFQCRQRNIFSYLKFQ